MILYITYNDTPSGIYSSQVIDVVKYIHLKLETPCKLISFISLRGFSKNRKKIKQELKAAIVLPMYPGIKRWRSNTVLLKLLCLFFQPRILIGRSVLATHLALNCRKSKRKIIYDGRGAIAAEWKEYGVVTNLQMLSEIPELEKTAILNSDFRIAVSQQLVNYWEEHYTYKNNQHEVIPCTLNEVFETADLSPELIMTQRSNLGINTEDLVFVYSGSIAGWQSFDLLYSYIEPLLKSSLHVKLLFLSDKDSHILKLEKEFPGQILCKKVSPEKVPAYLMAADFGLLIREASITNKVASPVKFAEYLACGLKVIISDQLGDYTNFVNANACGFISTSPEPPVKPVFKEKNLMRNLALKNFTKSNFRNSFIMLTR